MKLKYLQKQIFILIILLISFSKIKPTEANLVTETFVIQTTTITRNSANNNNNNLLVMFMISGIGFTLGLQLSFFLFGRTSITDKKPLEKNSSQNIIEAPIEMSPNKKDTSSYIVYIEKAYNKFAQGDIEGTLKNFNDGIRYHPNNAKIYSERAYFRKNKLGDKEGAIADYTQAIDINPDNAFLYFCRSQTYLELGNRQKAIEDYNTGMDIAPENIMCDSTSNDQKTEIS